MGPFKSTSFGKSGRGLDSKWQKVKKLGGGAVKKMMSKSKSHWRLVKFLAELNYILYY